MTLYGKGSKQSEKKRQSDSRQDRARKDLLLRSIAAATTFTFFSPMVASADIISGNDAITSVTKDGNIYMVESHKLLGSSAINYFSKFGLDANTIANLYFGTKENHAAANLFNFVDGRIDINGTVNALQNGKIGGNLFFLSKEGTAVGAGGVINAGSLTLLTPSEDYYKTFITGGAWNGDMSADAFAGELTKMQSGNIPLNPTGEIMVKGKVSAPNGILMKAASINIDSTAQLKTGTVDFTDLVNAGMTDNTVFDGSQNLTVEKTASGDIVLSAYSDVRNKKDEDFTQTILGITGAGSETANNNTIEASVTSKGTIDAAGNVTITATSANGQQFFGKLFDEPTGFGTNETLAYQIAQSVAKIDVAEGSVSGQKVTIAAKADNSYIDKDSIVKSLALSALGAITVNMDAAYAVLDGKASVNVGKDAVVEAKSAARTDANGKSVDALSITAKSRVQGSVGASTAGKKLGNALGQNTIPAAAVAYIEIDNEAVVNIDGTLKSAGNTKIDAQAETQMIASANSNTKTLGNAHESVIDAAVVIANGDTQAKVVIGETAKMTSDTDGTNLDGDLKISALTENQIHTEAGATGGDGALGATAVNVVSYDTSADVTVGTSIEAEDISIAAGNAVTDNTVSADNELGKSAMSAKLGKAVMTSETVKALTRDLLPKIVNKIPEKVRKAILSAPDENFASKVGDMVSIGASVAVAEESNQANVTVKQDAGITARGTSAADPNGDVSITANNNILDTKMSAIGKTNNNGGQANNKGLVSAGALFADMDNEANVIVEGRTSTDVGKIRGGDITMTATNTMQYNRVTAMVGELLWAVQKVKSVYDDIPEYVQDMMKFESLLSEAQEEMAADPNYLENAEFLDLAMRLGQAADGLVKDAHDIGLREVLVDGMSVFDILSKATEFADLSNYSNFTVNNTTGGRSFVQDEAKAAVAGNIDLATVSHTGRVLIGKNTAIDASGKLDIGAKGSAESVNVTGGLPGKTGSTVGLGGSFSLQRYDVENVTMVAEGAQLSGSAIDLSADNDVMQVGVVTQSGISSSASLNGMVNLMLGDSNSLVFVDDEATLTAAEAATGTITAGVNDGSITIGAMNDTSVTNIAGGFSMGDNVSVGVGLALTDYTVNNMAGIADNDSDADHTDKAEENVSAKRQNNVAKAMRAARAASGLTNEQSAALFGAKATEAESAISANSLSADALTKGTVNSVSVAGSAAMTDDSDAQGIFTQMAGWFMDTKLMRGVKAVETKAADLAGRLDGLIGGKIHDKFGSDVDNTLNAAPAAQGGGGNRPNPNTLHTQSINVGAAGSVSVNALDKNTGAVIDGANITLHKNANNGQGSSLSVTAKDEAFAGAWSGSAGITWKTTTAAANRQPSVGIAGAVGMNILDSSVQSAIADSTIVDADTITNAALSQATAAAAGLGANVTIASGDQSGAAVGVTASVSANDIDSEVCSLMEDNTVSRTDTDKTDITVSAFGEDMQIAGGVNAAVAAGGSFGASVGGALTVSVLSNDVQAGISGGTYTSLDETDVSALMAARQVSGAVGVGVQAGSDVGFAFEGAAVCNTIDNTANAFIDDAAITATSVKATAKDTIRSASEWEDYIEARGLESDGESVQDNAVSIDEVGEIDGDGTLIVTSALAVAGSSGKAGVAGAVAVDAVSNDRTASVTGSTITADSVSVGSDADSVFVTTAAGAGGSNTFGGVGSVGWHDIDNDVIAKIDKSTITANTADVLADNSAVLVNVAGQVAAGSVSVGAAVAYQGIDNTTGAYITGSTLEQREVLGIDVNANAFNTGDIISITAGVGAAGATGNGAGVAVNGAAAVNRGANDTEAFIGASSDGTRSAITDADDVKVKAEDTTSLTAMAGGIGAAKTAAVSGAIAYNDIGGSALTTEKSTQHLRAGIDHTDITTTSGISSISAEAVNMSDILTAAVGIGGSGTAAVQGASQTTLINKTMSATMSDTNIDKDTSGAASAQVMVKTEDTSKINSNASTVSGSGTAGVGAGVSVNRIMQDTSAVIAGGKQNVDSLLVKSASAPQIFATAVGGAVAGTAGIAGSAIANIIEDNSIAKITGGADITAYGSVGVVSENDQVISNYAGMVAGSGTAAVGATAAGNSISGTSEAIVEDSSVIAKGKGDTVSTNSRIDDDAIVDKLFTEDVIDPFYNLKDKRQEETHRGLVVDSSSTHNLRSFLVSGGGSGAAAVEVTANINLVGGSTTAAIDNSTVNGGTDGDIAVRARDYTNSTGLVGSAAGSMYAAVIPATDTNVIDRTVRAAVTDSDTTDATATTISGDDVIVAADSKQGISSFGAGAAAAIEGAGVGAVLSVMQTEGTTEAIVTDTTVTADTSSVTADHLGRTNAGNISAGIAVIGGGVGAAIGVNVDDSVTRAHIADSAIKTSGTNHVGAMNRTEVRQGFVSGGVAAVGGGVAGSVIVNNLDNTVETIIDNSTLEGKTVQARADNDIDLVESSGSAGIGIVGAGVGAGVVVNTIDSQTITAVTDSQLTATDDVTIRAEETREIAQAVGSGSLGIGGIGANVMVTNIGKTIDETNMTIDTVTQTAADGTQTMTDVDTKGLVDFANEALDVTFSQQTIGLTPEEAQSFDAAKSGANYGSGDAITATTVSHSTIKAADKADISAEVLEDINMLNANAAVGGVDVLATVGVANVHHNIRTDLVNSTSITAKTIEAEASAGDLDGRGILIETVQGSVGLATVGAAVGIADIDGKTALNVGASSLSADTISLRGKDTSAIKTEALGVQVGAVAVGAIVAQAKNDSDVYVTVFDSNLNQGKASGDTSILADKENTVSAFVQGGTGGLINGIGLRTDATDSGNASLSIAGGEFGGKKADLRSHNAPSVTSKVDNDTYGAAAVQVGLANASADLGAYLTVSGSKLLADTVSIGSTVGKNGVTTVHADLVSVNGTGIEGSGNVSEAELYADSNVNVTGATYKTTTDLIVTSDTDIKTEADAEGLNIGIIATVGNNKAIAKTESNTSVKLDGTATVKSLTVKANGAAEGDARAESAGGGAISGSEAAHAENSLTSDAKVDLGGNWNVTDAVVIEAHQTDRANMHAYGIRGSLIGGAGVLADMDVKGTTEAVLNGTLTADTVSAAAKNDITTGDEYTYAAKGGSYGAVEIGKNKSELTVDKSTHTNIDADITTTKTQTYEALTDANIKNRSTLEVVEAVGGAYTYTVTDTDIDNKVTLGENKTLKTEAGGQDGDITIAASDTLDITATGESDIPASAVSGASATTEIDTARTNTVEIKGKLNSMNDINLYAGKDVQGSEASLLMDAEAVAYTKAALVGLPEPILKNEMAQSNQVIVADTGVGESVRNINISADVGEESIRERASRSSWIYGGTDNEISYVGVSEGKEMKNKTTDNTVRVDGTLTTGTNKTQTVVINGRVAPPGTQIVGTAGDAGFTVTVNGEAMEGATVSTMDYGNMLFAQYQEATKLMNEYKGKYDAGGSTKDLSAYLGYKAEQERILAQMDREGLLMKVTQDGQTKYMPIEGYQIYVVELPDIISSGGNINVETDTLYGSGSLIAQGAPQIDITNDSTAYLKVNDLTVGTLGGELLYNAHSIKSDDHAAIQKLNRNKQASVAFAAVKADDPSAQNAKISILSTDVTSTQIESTGSESTGVSSGSIEWTPIKTIDIGGVISNPNGIAAITNEAGDIVLQDSAGIEAKTIDLKAAGSVAQGVTEGIVNIGGNPEDQWAEYANSSQDTVQEVLEENGLENDLHGMVSADVLDSNTQSGSWIVGGEVYISASDINVNGTIQSGFSKYQVTIDEGDIAGIAKTESNTAYIDGKKVYKINNGNRAVLRPDGTYAFEVQAYYDPDTDKIFIDDIESRGGKVYLTGRIASTGNGRIIALDSGAKINIASTATSDMVVGKIINNDGEGLIRITDLNKKQTMDIKSSGSTLTDQDGYVWDLVVTPTLYDPQDGLRYNWTTGTETTEEKTYQNDIKEGMWGAYEVSDKTALEDYEKTHSPSSTLPSETRDKMTGAYIDRVEEIGNNGSDYVLIYDNDVKSSEKSEVEKWTSTSGFLGWYHWTHYRWTVTTGSSQTYQHSIKADHDIGLDLLKEYDPSITISGAQNVTLGGSISNAAADAKLTVKALSGTITQTDGTKITGGNIDMMAKTGMAGIDVTAMERSTGAHDVYMQAETTTGNIDITVDGDLKAKTISTGGGSVDLTATDNIVNYDSTSSLVSGDRIDLTSGDAISLNIKGGQTPTTADSMSASVNASAKNDIALTQSEGDLRIGTIASQQGDVSLTAASGSIVDVLPTAQADTDSNTETRIQRWKDLGLIEGEGEFTRDREKRAATYREGVTKAYAYYAQQKAYYEAHPTEAKSDIYLKLAGFFDGYDSAEAFLAERAEYQDLTKTLTASDYEWTKEHLLYAIHDSVINKTSATPQVKDANITGRNITLTAEAGGIGSGSQTQEIVSLTTMDGLERLSTAENSDVTWYEGDDLYTDENGIQHKNVAVISDRSPLGIAASGIVSVNAKDDIYLAGRDASLENVSDSLYSTLNIGQITSTDGDVRLVGEKTLTAAGGSDYHVGGKDIIIESGEGGIGAADAPIVVQVGGALTARSEGDLYIQQKEGDLVISALYAAGDAKISSAQDIQSETDDIGYVNVQGDLTLEAGDDIGTDTTGLRILAGNQAISADADNIYIDGIRPLGSIDSTLVLHDLTAKESTVSVQSETSITSTGAITAQGDSGTVSITSADDVKLTAGLIEADSIALTAGKQIAQTAEHTLASTQTSAAAETGISLIGTNNRLGALDLDNTSGDIIVNNTGRLDLSADANDGDITVTNAGNTLALKSDLIATGDITLQNTNDDIVLGSNEVNAGGELTIKAHTKGDIVSTGTLAAAETMTLSAATGSILADNISAGSNADISTVNGDIRIGLAEIDGTTDITAETTGSIEIGELDSTGEASITASQGSINITKLDTDNDASIKTETGSITVGTAKADGDMAVSAGEGNIDITQADSDANADITADKGDITIDDIATAGDMAVSAGEGDIDITQADSDGEASVTADKGNVGIGTLSTREAATVGTGEGSITADSITSDATADITADKGDITIGALTSREAATVGTGEGNIIADSITSDATASVTTDKGDITIDDIATAGDMAVSAGEGDIDITQADSGADADITADKGDITIDDIATAGDMAVTAGEGDIGITKANSDGEANITADKGDITIDDIATAGDMAVTAGEGDIDITQADSDGEASVTADKGNVGIGTLSTREAATVGTGEGSITADSITSEATADITADKGDITIGALSTREAASVGTGEGSITADSITSEATASVTTDKGDITIDDIATAGDMAVSAGEGDIDITQADSDANASVTADKGNITIDDITTAGDMAVTAGEGDIGITKANSDGEANITADKGDITIDDIATAGDMAVTAGEGNIDITQADSGADADISAGTGDITAEEVTAQSNVSIQTIVGAIEANRITANDLVTITASQAGDITSDDIIQSLNDSVDIYTAQGDVDLHAVYAKQDASVGSGDGDVTIYTIDGENVFIAVENKENNLTAGTITAGDLVDLTGSKIDIDTIKQRDEYDNMLTISPRSPAEDEPIEHLNIGQIIAKNGVIFSQLWADYVDLHSDSEKFYFPRLRIGKVGHFSTNSTSVTLYGIMPWLDDANIQLWHDADSGTWTNLYFLRPHTIRTDSAYLNGDDWYTVFNERQSAVDMMRMNLMRQNSLYYQNGEKRRSASLYAPYLRYLAVDDSALRAVLMPILREGDILVDETL